MRNLLRSRTTTGLKLLCLCLFLNNHIFAAAAQIPIASWNLKHFGASKTPEDMNRVADALQDFDVVAIQEIVTAATGVQQLARLVTLLEQKGADWDFQISPPTNSSNPGEQERYAFIWKTKQVQLRKAGWLDGAYADSISREPFMADFIMKRKDFTLVNFHALPKSKQPEREIKWFKFFPTAYPGRKLIFLGDFNCPEQHSVFNPLKKAGYKAALYNQKTTLRQTCIKGDCLASAYDNIFYPSDFTLQHAGIIPFYLYYKGDQRAARKLSDHVPVFVVLE